MEIERKQDLSVYRWLVDLFSDFPQLHIRDAYPIEDLEIPSVSIEREDIDLLGYELGNRYGLSLGMWRIDIFGINKTQRDEIGYRILHNIENGINVYDYDEGFPDPPAYPTKIGYLLTDDIKMTFIKVFPDLVDTLYWRAEILFTTQYESQV